MSRDHTAGPWTLEVTTPEDNPGRLAAWGRVHRQGRHSIECDLADARLIAAAPELLAALESVTHVLDHANDDADDPGWLPGTDEYLAIGRARAVIAKARGAR